MSVMKTYRITKQNTRDRVAGQGSAIVFTGCSVKRPEEMSKPHLFLPCRNLRGKCAPDGESSTYKGESEKATVAAVETK